MTIDKIGRWYRNCKKIGGWNGSSGLLVWYKGAVEASGEFDDNRAAYICHWGVHVKAVKSLIQMRKYITLREISVNRIFHLLPGRVYIWHVCCFEITRMNSENQNASSLRPWEIAGTLYTIRLDSADLGRSIGVVKSVFQPMGFFIALVPMTFRL